MASCTLTVRREHRRRIIYLDEITAALASQWLRYRHQRWPGSRNPHLLVSQQTAADTSPVSSAMIWNIFEPLGVHPVRLRQDRILDEARHTAACANALNLRTYRERRKAARSSDLSERDPG